MDGQQFDRLVAKIKELRKEVENQGHWTWQDFCAATSIIADGALVVLQRMRKEKAVTVS